MIMGENEGSYEGKQQRMDFSPDGKEVFITDGEDKVEKKDGREFVSFNKDVEVWLDVSGGFHGFLQGNINAVRVKEVKGNASVYRFLSNNSDPENRKEVVVYIDGDERIMKSQDFFRTLKSYERAPKDITD